MVDVVENQVKLCPEKADEIITEFVVNPLLNRHEHTENFNDILKDASKGWNTNIIDDKIMCLLTSLPLKYMVERCDISKIDYTLLLRMIDRLFRYEIFDHRSDNYVGDVNPNKIPLYIWSNSASLVKPRINLIFRSEDLSPKMHTTLSVLMNLYQQMKDGREYELPAELYDHINEWLIDNDVSIKSASKS